MKISIEMLFEKLKKQGKFFCTLCIAFLMTAVLKVNALTEMTVRMPSSPDDSQQATPANYFNKLLQLALDKSTDEYGPYRLISLQSAVDTNERFAELRRGGNVDLLWSMTSPRLERDFVAIKASLLKGLGNNRIFLIREDSQEKFNHIKTLEDLKKLTAGMGTSWPDTFIMRANHLPVVTQESHNLFIMLAGKRFDYFSRGLYEVWDEQEHNAKLGIVVEKSILLNYDAPTYFFVRKGSEKLAKRIEKGLAIADADGSWDALFFSIPGFKKGFQELKEHNRRVFHLNLSQE